MTVEVYGPGEAAEQTGLSLDTLRYYEREGLVGPIGRTAGGQRTYTSGDVAWIGLLTCLRDAGLGIADLRDFTRLLREDPDASDDVVGFLRAHRGRLEHRVDAARQALSVVDDKIAWYERRGLNGAAQVASGSPSDGRSIR